MASALVDRGAWLEIVISGLCMLVKRAEQCDVILPRAHMHEPQLTIGTEPPRNISGRQIIIEALPAGSVSGPTGLPCGDQPTRGPAKLTRIHPGKRLVDYPEKSPERKILAFTRLQGGELTSILSDPGEVPGIDGIWHIEWDNGPCEQALVQKVKFRSTVAPGPLGLKLVSMDEFGGTIPVPLSVRPGQTASITISNEIPGAEPHDGNELKHFNHFLGAFIDQPVKAGNPTKSGQCPRGAERPAQERLRTGRSQGNDQQHRTASDPICPVAIYEP